MNVAGRMRASAPMVIILALAGCGSQPHTGTYHSGGNHYVAGRPMYRVGEPYQIKGVWYYPAVDYNYDKTGTASWYGEQFHGRYTANGEIFDLNQLTAAHTTLPMPSIVEVTNLQNGRSLQLRVNDRGPFVDGRLIDVSRRAAQLLGFETKGTTPVRVRILKDASIEVAEEAMHNGGGAIMLAQAASVPPPMVQAALQPHAAEGLPSSLAANVVAGPIVDTQTAALPPSAPAPNVVAGPIVDTQIPTSPPRVAAGPIESPAGRIFVQAGAFSVRDNAQRVQSRIAPLGSVQVMTASVKGIAVYRVRLGPVENAEQADRLLQRVVNSGYREARIVSD
jgi:rare lipoprotein A